MLRFLVGSLGGRIGDSLPVVVAEAVRLRPDEGLFFSGELAPLINSNGDTGGVAPGEEFCVPPAPPVTPPSDSGSGREGRFGFLCRVRPMRVPRAP